MTTGNESHSFVNAASSTGDHLDVPDTSLLPGSERAPTGSVEMLKRVTRGAHETIDRIADTAAPQVQRLEDGLTSAGSALHARADQIRQTRDDWTEGLRCTVRANPLAALALALAFGALVARVTR